MRANSMESVTGFIATRSMGLDKIIYPGRLKTWDGSRPTRNTIPRKGLHMATIGLILKKIRENRKIPQGVMANKLGLTQNFLSQVENDKKKISFSKLEEISEKLGISKELILIAASDTPLELSDKEKKQFLEMQNSIFKYLLLDNQ